MYNFATQKVQYKYAEELEEVMRIGGFVVSVKYMHASLSVVCVSERRCVFSISIPTLLIDCFLLFL